MEWPSCQNLLNNRSDSHTAIFLKYFNIFVNNYTDDFPCLNKVDVCMYVCMYICMYNDLSN